MSICFQYYTNTTDYMFLVSNKGYFSFLILCDMADYLFLKLCNEADFLFLKLCDKAVYLF